MELTCMLAMQQMRNGVPAANDGAQYDLEPVYAVWTTKIRNAADCNLSKMWLCLHYECAVQDRQRWWRCQSKFTPINDSCTRSFCLLSAFLFRFRCLFWEWWNETMSKAFHCNQRSLSCDFPPTKLKEEKAFLIYYLWLISINSFVVLQLNKINAATQYSIVGRYIWKRCFFFIKFGWCLRVVAPKMTATTTTTTTWY